jgi:hypothetical protein
MLWKGEFEGVLAPATGPDHETRYWTCRAHSRRVRSR